MTDAAGAMVANGVLTAQGSSLLIVDVQEARAPVMADPRRVIDGCSRLLRGAARLGIPVTVTEHDPDVFGPTMVDLRDLLAEVADAVVIGKRTFDGTAAPDVLDRLRALGRPQVVLAGLETHVAVLQTAFGAAAAGLLPSVVIDACSTRLPEDARLAELRFGNGGIAPVSVEMVLFEWLGASGTAAYRDITDRLIR